MRGTAHAGYESIAAGLLFEGGIVQDGSGLYGTSLHAGASARWTRYGDVFIHGSVSAYEDATIGRLAPQWKIHVAGPVSVLPGFALQFAPGGAFPNASLTGIGEWASVSIWAGGKAGEEVRPAYLDQNVVYDIPERVEFGAWAGARARPLSWPVATGQLLVRSTPAHRRPRSSPHESDLHAFAMGPSVNF